MKLFNNKGSVNDLFFYTIMFFIIVVLVVGVYTGYYNMKDILTDNDIYTVEGEQAVEKVNNVFLSFDTLLIILLVFFGIVAFISAFLVKVHPIFAPVAIISFIICVLLSMVIANTYSLFQENDTVSDVTVQFTKLNYVMDYYPFIIIPIGMIFLIVLFSKMVYRNE